LFTHDFHGEMRHFKHFMHGGGRRGGFGGRGGFGPRGFGGRGRGRGEMKFEILDVLTGGPRHGYDIMLEIEAKTGMRPSAGSIYPALQMLEDGDFVRGEERDGKRTYTITDKGTELLKERPQGDADASADPNGLFAVMGDAMRCVHGIKDAAKHIAKSGDVELFRKALAVLERTRRELYAILAEDHDG
jgi:DNA-binding PadR family transcriptional regulator